MLTSIDLGRRWREQRFNPIRSLTPQSLSSALDQFEAGYLRQAAMIWELIEDRDDMVKTAVPKRRKAVSRRPWEIVKIDESPDAEADAEALTFFYNHVTATNAIDLNVRGGFRKLIDQMMTAEFYQYAAHEIVWQPRADENGRQRLTAEFRFVPLYFFENRTGRLRYIGPDGLIDGRDLEENGWMITCGDGLHKAISICRMFKSLSLQDWINYSEKFGLPGIHGKTDAAVGTPEWDKFVDGLAKFANDFVIATSQGTEIALVEVGKTGDAPFAPMVERMDRRITALCRGADLGTLSSKDATGATLQEDETDILIEDDCANISETLNTHVDRFVLGWLNGARDAKAYIKLLPPVEQDTAMDINVDKHLVALGGLLDASETYERYGRTMPEEMKTKVLGGVENEDENEDEKEKKPAANDLGLGLEISAYLRKSEEILGEAFGKAMAPARAAVLRVLNAPNDEFALALDNLSPELVRIAREAGARDEAADAFAAVLSGALFNGLTEAKS